MPYFYAYLEDISGFSSAQRGMYGKLYRLMIAPPDDRYGGVSIPAYFYPEDAFGWMGAKAADAFGLMNVSQITFSIRNEAAGNYHQVDLEAPTDKFVVNPQLPLDFIRIDGSLISAEFEFLNWPKQTYLSAPLELKMKLRMKLRRDPCYDRRDRAAESAARGR